MQTSSSTESTASSVHADIATSEVFEHLDLETPNHKVKKAVFRKIEGEAKQQQQEEVCKDRCLAKHAASPDFLEDRGWTEKSNALIIRWLSRCTRNMTTHSKRIKRLRTINIAVTMLYIILNTLSGSMAFFNVGGGTVPDKYKFIIDVFIAVSNLATTILAGILAFLELPATVQKEKYSITKFSKLVRSLEIVVYADIEDRPNAKDFLDNVSEKYYKYHTASDVVDEYVEEWRKRLTSVKKKKLLQNNSKKPKSHIVDLWSALDACESDADELEMSPLNLVNFDNEDRKPTKNIKMNTSGVFNTSLENNCQNDRDHEIDFTTMHDIESGDASK